MANKKQAELTAAMKEVSGSAKSVVIRQIEIESIALEVEGTADLIQNNFAQKGIEQMLAKHMGISVSRETKKPREVIENAKILNTKGEICVSPVAFKAAMISGASTIKSLKKTQLRTSLFVEGNSIPITFESMEPRMDVVRVGGASKVPDIRFRPSFINWKARLIIQFSDLLNVQTVVDLLQRAGRVGVGEWRPEKNGTFGTFRVSRALESVAEVAEVRELCTTPLVRPVIPPWAFDLDISPEAIKKLAGAMGAAVPSDEDQGGDEEEEAEMTDEQRAELAELKNDYAKNPGKGKGAVGKAKTKNGSASV
jgi:hypothetical protein